MPFFWSQHYDVTINYVGHAEHWDAVQIDGALDARDCAVSYKRGDRTLAVATIVTRPGEPADRAVDGGLSGRGRSD